ncbi:MAG: SH3 domain-containing protein [Thermodesulfobacteriota bacterium]
MRSGPGLGYEVLWYLSRGYPLEVMAAKGEWLKVRDYEGDIGWVFRKLTSRESHVIVKKENVNLRSRPDVKSSVVVRVNRGVLLRSLGSQGRWVKVRYAQGGSGWIARRLVWGW